MKTSPCCNAPTVEHDNGGCFDVPHYSCSECGKRVLVHIPPFTSFTMPVLNRPFPALTVEDIVRKPWPWNEPSWHPFVRARQLETREHQESVLSSLFTFIVIPKPEGALPFPARSPCGCVR